MLGLCGVIIVLLSVLASIGLLSYLGVKSTLIIVEVIPFLVLAVGVDNIFILVQHFGRIRLEKEEHEALSYDEALQVRMRRLMTYVTPSILLAACAESSCFFLGAITPMPAVRVFALNAGIALLIAFFFQMLIFVPVLAFDARRLDQNRMEIFCCFRGKKNSDSSDAESSGEDSEQKEGYLYWFFSKIYAPFLMKKFSRLFVVSQRSFLEERYLFLHTLFFRYYSFPPRFVSRSQSSTRSMWALNSSFQCLPIRMCSTSLTLKLTSSKSARLCTL